MEAHFTIGSWDEKTVDEATPKLTHAVIRQAYTGALEGSSVVVFSMAYHDAGADFVGHERFTGTFAGRTGTLVFRHQGTYTDEARSVGTVIDATGDLAGVTGTIRYATGETTPVRLEVDLQG